MWVQSYQILCFIFTTVVNFLVSDPQFLIYKAIFNHKHSFQNYNYYFLYKICKSVWLTCTINHESSLLMFSFVLLLLTGEAIGVH